MEDLRGALEQMRGRRVLVVGDVMLDEYLRGHVSRISPEAPVPILEVHAHEWRLGGAANTAANIQGLGGHAYLVGVVGKDETASTLSERLAHHGIVASLVPDPDRPTIKKTRLVAQQQQIVRVDHEKRGSISAAISANVMHAIESRLVDAHAVVVSDYAKGVVSEAVARFAIEKARAAGLPVIVDPKQRDFAVYRGATVITPNVHELETAAKDGHGDVVRAAHSLLPLVDGAALLVTRSADGMTLFRRDTEPFHVAAIAKEVFDVTGAGDTVVASLALVLGAGLPIEMGVRLASVTAAIAVSKHGTSIVTPAEILAALDRG